MAEVSANEQERMIRFLLGGTSQEETDEIESRVFDDDLFFTYICALEGELIRDYARGALPPNLMTQFEEKLRESSTWRERLSAEKRLIHALQQGSRRGLKAWLGSLQRSWHPPRSLALAATVTFIAILIVVLGIQSALLWQRVNHLEAVMGQTGSRVVATRAPATVAFLLFAGRTKSAQPEARPLHVPSGAVTMQLELVYPASREGAEYSGYLTVADGNSIEWSGTLRPVANRLIAVIPATILRNTEYILVVRQRERSSVWEDVSTFSFTVATD